MNRTNRLILAACALLAAARAPAPAAPVPPAPRLSAELMVGRWELSWGESPGVMWFHSDHTYAQMIHDRRGVVWTGTWSIEDGVIVLDEWATQVETGSTSGPVRYRYQIDVRCYPHLSGTANGSTQIVLRDPKR